MAQRELTELRRSSWILDAMGAVQLALAGLCFLAFLFAFGCGLLA